MKSSDVDVQSTSIDVAAAEKELQRLRDSVERQRAAKKLADQKVVSTEESFVEADQQHREAMKALDNVQVKLANAKLAESTRRKELASQPKPKRRPNERKLQSNSRGFARIYLAVSFLQRGAHHS